MTTKIGFGMALLLALGGCSTAPASGESVDAVRARSTMFSCKVDSDCVVIEDDTSCDEGVLVAVNKDHADRYCGYENPDVDCSIPAWSDTRVAQCDFSAHKCQMIEPTAIHCGGFINPNHGCPDGFSCDFHGHVPDVGGSCVADATTTN